MEIGNAVNLKSGSAVSYQIGVLEMTGYLSRQPSRPRSDRRHGALPAGPDQRHRRATQGDDVACVPLVGRIAAGGPILAVEDIEEDLPLPRSLVGYGDLIALRVRGDSMIGAGINHGDVVVIRKQPRVEIGENAAAMIRDEVTGDFEATIKEISGVTTVTPGSSRATLPTRPSPATTPGSSERSRPSCVAASDEVSLIIHYCGRIAVSLGIITAYSADSSVELTAERAVM